jgi:sulfite oxidase
MPIWEQGGRRSSRHTYDIFLKLTVPGNRRAGLANVRPLPEEHPWGPGATSTAVWTGARLSEVLATAGMDAAAGHVAFLAADVCPQAHPPQPFGASIPIKKATAGRSCWPGR